METGCGKVFMETLILESGNAQELMGTEFMSGKMVTDTKGNGKIVSNMDLELTSSATETFI